MVIKRTIASLKTRPHDERRAFAGMCAIVVMVVLTGSWGAVFFRSIQNVAADEPYQGTAHTNAPHQTAAAASSLNSIVQSTITSDIGAQLPADTTDIASSTDANTGAQYGASQIPASSSATGADNDVVKTLQAALRQ